MRNLKQRSPKFKQEVRPMSAGGFSLDLRRHLDHHRPQPHFNSCAARTPSGLVTTTQLVAGMSDALQSLRAQVQASMGVRAPIEPDVAEAAADVIINGIQHVATDKQPVEAEAETLLVVDQQQSAVEELQVIEPVAETATPKSKVVVPDIREEMVDNHDEKEEGELSESEPEDETEPVQKQMQTPPNGRQLQARSPMRRIVNDSEFELEQERSWRQERQQYEFEARGLSRTSPPMPIIPEAPMHERLRHMLPQRHGGHAQSMVLPVPLLRNGSPRSLMPRVRRSTSEQFLHTIERLPLPAQVPAFNFNSFRAPVSNVRFLPVRDPHMPPIEPATRFMPIKYSAPSLPLDVPVFEPREEPQPVQTSEPDFRGPRPSRESNGVATASVDSGQAPRHSDATPDDEMGELAALKKAAAASLRANRLKKSIPEQISDVNENEVPIIDAMGDQDASRQAGSRKSSTVASRTEAAAFLSSLSMFDVPGKTKAGGNRDSEGESFSSDDQDMVEKDEDLIMSSGSEQSSVDNSSDIMIQESGPEVPKTRSISESAPTSRIRFTIARKPSDPFVIHLDESDDDEETHATVVTVAASTKTRSNSKLDLIRSSMRELKKRIALAEARKNKSQTPSVSSSKKRNVAVVDVPIIENRAVNAPPKRQRMDSRSSIPVHLVPEIEMQPRVSKEAEAQVVAAELDAARAEAEAQAEARAKSEAIAKAAAEADAKAKEEAEASARAAEAAAAAAAAKLEETRLKRQAAVKRRLLSIAKLQERCTKAEKRIGSYQTRLDILQEQKKRVESMMQTTRTEIDVDRAEIQRQQNELRMLRKVMGGTSRSMSPVRRSDRVTASVMPVSSSSQERRQINVDQYVAKTLQELKSVSLVLAASPVVGSLWSSMPSDAAVEDVVQDFDVEFELESPQMDSTSSRITTTSSRYVSPLCSLRSYRLSPHFSGDIRSALFGRMSGLICSFDLLGQCNDDSCSGIHLHAESLDESVLRADLLAYLHQVQQPQPSDGTASALELIESIRAACRDSVHAASTVSFSLARSNRDKATADSSQRKSAWSSHVAARLSKPVAPRTSSRPNRSLSPSPSQRRADVADNSSTASMESEEDFVPVSGDLAAEALFERAQAHQKALEFIDSAAADPSMIDDCSMDIESESDAATTEVLNFSESESRYFAASHRESRVEHTRDLDSLFERAIGAGSATLRSWLAYARWKVICSERESSSSPSRGSHWLDSCLHVLTRSVEAFPRSPCLWRAYLGVFGLREPADDEVRSLLRSALHYCPMDTQLWHQSLSSANTLSEVIEVADRALDVFSAHFASLVASGYVLTDDVAAFIVDISRVFVGAGQINRASLLLVSCSSSNSTANLRFTASTHVYLTLCAAFLSARHILPSFSMADFQSTLDSEPLMDSCDLALDWRSSPEGMTSALDHMKSVASSLDDGSQASLSALNVLAREIARCAACFSSSSSLQEVLPLPCLSRLSGRPDFESWAVYLGLEALEDSTAGSSSLWLVACTKILRESSDAAAVLKCLCIAARALNTIDSDGLEPLAEEVNSADVAMSRRLLKAKLPDADVYIWCLHMLLEGLDLSADASSGADRMHVALQQALCALVGTSADQRTLLCSMFLETASLAKVPVSLQLSVVHSHLEYMVPLLAPPGSDLLGDHARIAFNLRQYGCFDRMMAFVLRSIALPRRRVEVLQAVSKKIPESVSLTLRLCFEAMQLGWFHVAASSLGALTTSFPAHSSLWCLLANVNMCRGRVYLAIANLKNGISHSPLVIELYNQLLSIQKEWASAEDVKATEEALSRSLLSQQ